jgi:hypothetical protein
LTKHDDWDDPPLLLVLAGTNAIRDDEGVDLGVLRAKVVSRQDQVAAFARDHPRMPGMDVLIGVAPGLMRALDCLDADDVEGAVNVVGDLLRRT